MLVLDTNKITIRDKNAVKKEFYLDFKSAFQYLDIGQINTKIENFLNFIPFESGVNYVFYVKNKIDDDKDFITLTDIFTLVFCHKITTKEKRDREMRLDAPENLLNKVHLSRWLIKNLVNYKTLINNFNLHIICGEFTYAMLGGPNE